MDQAYSARGAGLIILAGAIGTIISIYDYLTPATGLQQTGGVELTAAASILMLLAGLGLLEGHRPRLVQLFLTVCLALDIVCTVVAAYFLESPVLIAAMMLALVGLLTQVVFKRRPSQRGD